MMLHTLSMNPADLVLPGAVTPPTLSPSKNPCKVRVTRHSTSTKPNRRQSGSSSSTTATPPAEGAESTARLYRNDPYRAVVLPPIHLRNGAFSSCEASPTKDSSSNNNNNNNTTAEQQQQPVLQRASTTYDSITAFHPATTTTVTSSGSVVNRRRLEAHLPPPIASNTAAFEAEPYDNNNVGATAVAAGTTVMQPRAPTTLRNVPAMKKTTGHRAKSNETSNNPNTTANATNIHYASAERHETAPTTTAKTTAATGDNIFLHAHVAFKHESIYYTLDFQAYEGEYVCVEADRGYHVGRITTIYDKAPPYNVPCKILRHATFPEVQYTFELKRMEEEVALFAQQVTDEMGVPMMIVDAELQFDLNKLTLFFTSRRHVDFRRVQRILYNKYRCRIWFVSWTDIKH